MLALFHEVRIVNEVLIEMYLLESLLVHEVISVLILVKELVRPSLDIDGLDLRSCGKRVLEDTSVLKVTELGLHESRTFARFYMLEPHNGAWLAVIIDVQSVFEISCCCHKYVF